MGRTSRLKLMALAELDAARKPVAAHNQQNKLRLNKIWRVIFSRIVKKSRVGKKNFHGKRSPQKGAQKQPKTGPKSLVDVVTASQGLTILWLPQKLPARYRATREVAPRIPEPPSPRDQQTMH